MLKKSISRWTSLLMVCCIIGSKNIVTSSQDHNPSSNTYLNKDGVFLSIGLMSGTSMDGIDAALLATDGRFYIQEIASVSLPYTDDSRILLKAAGFAVHNSNGDLLAAKKNYPSALKNYLIQELGMSSIQAEQRIKALADNLKVNEITFSIVEEHSTYLHAQVVKKMLKKSGYTSEQIDIVGYHGQTLFHRPSNKVTIQIGNGQTLAKLTGITVINDFRSRDVSLGGEGAPFAPLYHQALLVKYKKYPAAVVNCGGISNITIIQGLDENEILGFDCGPGNGLIDLFIEKHTLGRENMDEDGKYGHKGHVNELVLKLLYEKSIIVKGTNYLELSPPKSLDIRDARLIPELEHLSFEDACATLEAFTAEAIVDSLKFVANYQVPKYWILAGGGWNNPVIKRELKSRLKKRLGSEIECYTAKEVGWDNKAIEAQIFAYLGVRSLLGLPISLPNTTKVPIPLSGGHAHRPPKGGTLKVEKLLKLNPAVLYGYKE